jgi:hypothetical protein
VSTSALSVAVPASVAVIVAVLSALAAYLARKRERRRELYGQAVKTAVGWQEMLYRVRRRAAGEERDLIARFHDLQDDLSYQRAWVGSESKYMKRSYDRLADGVKRATAEPIRSAWEQPLRAVPGNATPEDANPDVDPLIEAFLTDVRLHLSPWPWRKLALASRNRAGA